MKNYNKNKNNKKKKKIIPKWKKYHHPSIQSVVRVIYTQASI